jgi:8-oxo-dGTP pyrophosphatase MutT (NUDIX family)
MIDIEPSAEIPKPIELAGCLPVDEQGRFLLIHRKTDLKDQLETIGGKTERDETEEQTILREFDEEIEGVELELGAKLGDVRFYEDGKAYLYHLFLGRITSGEAKPREDMHIEVKWWTSEELQKTNQILSNNVRGLLDAISVGEITLPQQNS